MKSAFDKLISRFGEKTVSDLEDIWMDTLKTEKQGQQNWKKNFQGMWHSYKWSNRRRKRERYRRNIWNNNENFPKLMSDTKSQFQEAQRTHAGLILEPYTQAYHFQTASQKN